MVSERLLWGTGTWVADTAPAAEDACIVDSFLVENGRVTAPEAHQARFVRSCQEIGLGIEPDRMNRFWVAAWQSMPDKGQWFPRLEAHRGENVALVRWVRPAPALADAIRLWVPSMPDPRRFPQIKGPDLAALAELRADAIEHGADDAVLAGVDGVVRECAHTALLWWRDDVLCYPGPDLPILPSITAHVVLTEARARGYEVRAEYARWAELTGLEVWAVNALHGIRPVIGWRRGDRECRPPASDVARLTAFRSVAAPRPLPTLI